MRFSGKRELIKSVQRELGILADGLDGPVTWKTIYDQVKGESEKPSSSSIAEDMVNLAKSEIGVSEIDGTNCGPRVDEYKAATWLDPDKGWPWCAAFICWLVREAIENKDVDFKRPQTAGAWDFENWARKQEGKGVALYKPVGEILNRQDNDRPYIRKGDIVVFRFSHIGLAIGEPMSNGHVATIEGNTNGAGSREGGSVLEKNRRVSSIRSVIRIS